MMHNYSFLFCAKTQAGRTSFMRADAPLTTTHTEGASWLTLILAVPTSATKNTLSRTYRIAEIVGRIKKRVVEPTAYEPHEPRPTSEVTKELTAIFAELGNPISVLQSVQVSTFYGELQLTWARERKEVMLVSGGGFSDPKIHYYERRPHEPSASGFADNASAKTLEGWLDWLDE